MPSSLPDYEEADLGSPELPEYRTTYEVRESCGLQGKLFEIEMDQKREYDVGEIISGNAYIRPYTQDIDYDKVMIELVLVESICRTNRIVENRLVRRLSLAQHRVCGVEDYPIDGKLHKGLVYKFPFSLIIPFTNPYACTAREDHDTLHTFLPSNVGANYGADFGWRRDEDVKDTLLRINYIVRGRIINQKECQSEISMSINLHPTYKIEAHNNKHIVSEKLPLRLRSRRLGPKTQLGLLAFTVTRIPTLSLQSNGQILALKLLYTATTKSPPPRQDEVLFNYKLISHTIVSTHRAQIVPKPGQSGFRTVSEVLCQRQLQLTDFVWNKVSGTESEADVVFRVILPTEERIQGKIVPTFSTCISTRVYEIEVDVVALGTVVPLTFPVVVMNNKST